MAFTPKLSRTPYFAKEERIREEHLLAHCAFGEVAGNDVLDAKCARIRRVVRRGVGVRRRGHEAARSIE